jgi:hypothetical protein
VLYQLREEGVDALVAMHLVNKLPVFLTALYFLTDAFPVQIKGIAPFVA